MKNKTTYDRAMHDSSHPYTCISAELINNEDLTGEERFLLIYLLGRSDDYIFHSTYFAKDAKKLFGWGKQKFYKIWINLQKKGFISKEKIRVKGMIDGEHYTVHEILPDLLKNQNTENPESGESGIWKTRTLPSIDKPNIDKLSNDEPSNTNTYHEDGVLLLEEIQEEEPEEITKEEINDLYEFIKEKNPNDQTTKWRLTKKDKELLHDAIEMYGIDKAKSIADKIISRSKKDYSSVSYVFSDLKNDFPSNDSDEEFLEDSLIEVIGSMDNHQMYDYIKNVVGNYHTEANYWEPSDKDLEICTILTDYGDKIDLREKLSHGLKSAVKKDKWSFQQITYQAMAALNNYDEIYTL